MSRRKTLAMILETQFYDLSILIMRPSPKYLKSIILQWERLFSSLKYLFFYFAVQVSAMWMLKFTTWQLERYLTLLFGIIKAERYLRQSLVHISSCLLYVEVATLPFVGPESQTQFRTPSTADSGLGTPANVVFLP